MNWKTKLTISLLTALLLQSCGSSVFQNDSDLNRSSLYDPPTITLVDGQVYRFKDGLLEGRGQKFHSDYSYRRAIIIGK
jgi:hypothetical protein